MKFFNFKMPLYEAETDTAGGAAGAAQTETSTETTAEQGKTYTEEEMTAIKTQSEKEFAAYKEKAEQEKQAAVEEALKKAKMTADEKVKYEQEQALKALEERERNIALRELKADTAKLLADKQLPAEALEYVLGEDSKATIAKIESFEKMFSAAVQAQVESRLKGKSPTWGVETSSQNVIAKAFDEAFKI